MSNIWLLQPDGKGACCNCGTRSHPCDLCSTCTPFQTIIEPSQNQFLVISSPTGLIFKDGENLNNPPGYIAGTATFSDSNSIVTMNSSSVDYQYLLSNFINIGGATCKYYEIIPNTFTFQVQIKVGDTITMYCETYSPAAYNSNATPICSSLSTLSSANLTLLGTGGLQGELVTPTFKNTFFNGIPYVGPGTFPPTNAGGGSTIFPIQGSGFFNIISNGAGTTIVGSTYGLQVEMVNPIFISVYAVSNAETTAVPSVPFLNQVIITQITNIIIQDTSNPLNQPQSSTYCCAEVQLLNNGYFAITDINGNPVNLTTRMIGLNITESLP